MNNDRGSPIAAHILNVDDHAPGRYARTRFLTRAGFRVSEARNGHEALQMTQDLTPDLILLDINLPDINGFEVCSRIKESPEFARIPVVFLSAARLADLDVVQGLELGADNYLREPVDPAVLVATVKALLRAREAEEELARSNEQLRRFAFVVSHELQEPLRMVKSYTQLLSRRYHDKLGAEANEYIDFAVAGVMRMERFIRDMLSYSQSVAGELEYRTVPARGILDMALMELETTIRESGASIDVGTLPVVRADATRVSQVFRNLIGNAIKYRSDQPVRICVRAREEQQDWVFSVGDNGVGFDPTYADAIFTIFKRLHGRDVPGSGVGLAICKEIVEKHGGKIWVDSEPGSGSTFHFSLPKQ